MRRETPEAAAPVGWTEEYWRDLNAALRDPEITPIGAYCMGAVTVALYQTGKLPTASQLRDAAKCTTVAEAEGLAKRWTAGIRTQK